VTIAAVLLLLMPALVFGLMRARRSAAANLWDHSMVRTAGPRRWYANLWVWWSLLAATLVGIYVKFW